MLSFWPGYDGLARYGRWTFLIVALAFALVLDLFIVLNFYWTAFLTPMQRNGFLGGLVVVWIVLGLVAGTKRRHLEDERNSDASGNKFGEAVKSYLQGHWLETETALAALLKSNPRDIEATLLKATLYRHTQRFAEAVAVLDQLSGMEESGRWFVEIETEKRLIREALQPPDIEE